MLDLYAYYEAKPEQIMEEEWMIENVKPEFATHYINVGKCVRCFATAFKQLDLVYNFLDDSKDVAMKMVEEKAKKSKVDISEFLEESNFRFFFVLCDDFVAYYDEINDVLEDDRNVCFDTIEKIRLDATYSYRSYTKFKKKMAQVAKTSRAIKQELGRYLNDATKIAYNLNFYDKLKLISRSLFEGNYCDPKVPKTPKRKNPGKESNGNPKKRKSPRIKK